MADSPPDPAAAATSRRRCQTERQTSRRERRPSGPERHPSGPERHPSGRKRQPNTPERQRSRHGSGGGHKALSRRRSAALPGTEHWTDLVHHMQSENLLPAIVFVFSRRRCDETAAALRGLDLTSDGEKQQIGRRLRQLEAHLSPADRVLGEVRGGDDGGGGGGGVKVDAIDVGEDTS